MRSVGAMLLVTMQCASAWLPVVSGPNAETRGAAPQCTFASTLLATRLF